MKWLHGRWCLCVYLGDGRHLHGHMCYPQPLGLAAAAGHWHMVILHNHHSPARFRQDGRQGLCCLLLPLLEVDFRADGTQPSAEARHQEPIRCEWQLVAGGGGCAAHQAIVVVIESAVQVPCVAEHHVHEVRVRRNLCSGQVRLGTVGTCATSRCFGLFEALCCYLLCFCHDAAGDNPRAVQLAGQHDDQHCTRTAVEALCTSTWTRP